MTVKNVFQGTIGVGLVTLLVVGLSICCKLAFADDTVHPETQSVTLAVENMSCAMCPITVRKSLERVDGVLKATADYATRTATVTFDPRKTTHKALTQATTHAGYPSTVKTD